MKTVMDVEYLQQYASGTDNWGVIQSFRITETYQAAFQDVPFPIDEKQFLSYKSELSLYS